MTDERMTKILSDNDFEFTLKELKSYLTSFQLHKLVEWVDKYKINLRKYAKFRINYAEFLLCGAELDEDDPNYDPNNGVFEYLTDDAPEEAKKLILIEKDYNVFGDALPNIEFTGDDIESC